MPSAFGAPVVIADVRAGRGRLAAALPDLERALRERGIDYRLVRAGGPAEVRAAAREAALGGERYLVAAGDDATVHQVVNGVLGPDGRPLAPGLVLGVVAGGLECDFIRTFGLPADTERAVGHLAGGATYAIDVGRVTCRGTGGEEVVRHFATAAQVGLGAAVRERLGRLPPRLGRARYFVAFWLTLATFRRPRAAVRTGGRSVEEVVRNVVVANCQFHDGLFVSPRSWPGDGLLDVLVMTGPRSEAFTLLPKLFRGEHLPHPHIVELKARTVQVEADPPQWVEADGEVVGRTPATFEAVVKPLSLKV
ncbi:MAG TPA: diacylglycerol kinase family protein [Actinomycetota bacterium]|nr:diacylglycerol kinase family protein [Actinomycetota bacterium]